jgi:phage-related minor tail protein
MALENAGYAVLTVIPSVRGIGAQMGAQLNAPIVKAARQAGDDAGRTLASRAGASIRSGASQISGAVSTVAAGAAAAGGAALASGFATALDMSAAQGKIQAQLGLTEKEAGRIGSVAGAVYSSGFGASMPEVSAAVGDVVQQMQFMRDASSADLQEVSRQAIVVADVLNVDVGRAARAAGQMVKTGLAADAEEAFDIMTAGAQQGANAADDLADTFSEYSTQFRNMGLSGADSVGLMTQGLNAGARDADTVADAIKEFSIEAVAGTDRVRTGYEMLGMDADEMFAKIGEGGSSARGALDETLDALREVPDTTERNAIATELFGTKAEDLGEALYALDLDTAAEGMGNMAGAAEEAADAVENTDAAKLASAWRELKTELGTELIPVLTQVATWVTNNMDVVKGAAVAVGVLGAAWATYKVATTAATVATGAWSVGKGIVQGATAGSRALIDLGSKAGPALDTVRLRAMYAGDAIKGAGTKAGAAAKGGITSAATAARTAGTAALTSARSWGTLAAAQTRAAVTATRARVATIATAAAQRTVRLATIAWTGVQWLLNTALLANPIGLVVAGIALLIGAAVLAYNKVSWFRTAVDAAFAGIGAAASWLGEQATALWKTYLAPAFTAIGSVVTWVFNSVILPVFRLYTAYIQNVLVPIVMWLWNNVISPAFKGIGNAISWAWTKIIRPAFTAVHGFISNTLAPIFTWLWQRVVTPAWNGIKTGISTAWSGIKIVFNYVKDGVQAVKRSFETARDGIGKAWDKVKDLTKAPARFVVESVYNEGIRKVWNWVADKVGLQTLDKVALPKGFARGGVLGGRSSWRQGDDQIIRARRGEGVAVSEAMRVPALRQELLRWNSIGTSGGTTALQRYVAGRGPRAGTPRPVREMAQGAGYTTGGIVGYAQGGIVEAVGNFGKDVVKGFLTGGLSGAVDKVAAPLVNVIKDKFGRSGFQGLPTRGVEYLVDGLKEKLKSFAGSLELNNGGAANWVGLATASERLQRAARWVDTQVGKPYQWGGGGNPSWDCSGFMAGIENVIRGLTPGRRYTTMDFRGSRAPAGWQQNLRSPFEVGVVNGSSARGSHMSGTLLGVNVESSGSKGVHKGTSARGASNSMYTHRYGFAPVAGDLYDDGGWLKPGYTVVENRTGQPEAVYTAPQQDRIDRMIAVLERQGHRPNTGHTFHITGSGDGRRTARHVVTALSDWERLHPVP